MMAIDRYRRLLPILLAVILLLLFGLPWLFLYRAEHRSYSLIVSTGQTGGVYHPLAEAITTAAAKDDPRLRFELTKSEGSVMSMRRLETGECDLALLQNGTPGGDEVRVLTPLYEEVLHILVPVDSGVKGLRDLRGKILGVGPKGSGTRQVVQRIFDHYGLEEGEFDAVYTDMSGACRRLLAGELDAAFIVTGVRAPAIQEAVSGGRLRMLGIGTPGTSGGEVDGLRLHFPYLNSYVIPENTYRSGDEGRPVQAVQTVSVASLLVCRRDLPDRVAGQMTRSIYENRASLMRSYPVTGMSSGTVDAQALSYPLHRGADDYYWRHEPGFLVEYADVIALVLSVAISLWGGIAGFRKWLHLKKKDRIDEYYVRIDEILTQLQENSVLDSERLREMEATLSELRQRAVQQLVAEKLLANESFRIFQVLLANSQMEVRRRLEGG